jgi:hypothetical protein
MGGNPRDRGPVIPCIVGDQQSLKGSGFRVWVSLWDWLMAGVWCQQVVGILVVKDPVVWPRGRYPSVVCVWWLEGGAAEGRLCR